MKKLILGLCCVVMLSSCGTAKKKLYGHMYDENPTSILVLPVVNNSTSAEAPLLYASTIAEPLSNIGYYIFPIDIVADFFSREGITTGAQLKGVSPKKYQQMFGADAVLAVTIHKWDTNYYVVGGNVTVELECSLVSTKTGDIFWTQRKTHVVPTTQDSGNLLANLIATAISTASVDYVPVAKQLNLAVFETMPYGKYHRRHKLDEADLVKE